MENCTKNDLILNIKKKDIEELVETISGKN
jgi:hypothetical protein